MNTNKPRHVMIDLETMGLKPGSAIVSIGAVVFDPRYSKVSKVKTFYRELDWESQDRTIDEETRNWWERQPKVAQDAMHGLDDLEAVLVELADWLPKDCKVWGNGPTFDITILEDAYSQFGIEVPWKFWNIRDCRTIKDMYESARGGYEKKSGGVMHHALDDAIHQAEYVCYMWRSLLAGK